MAASNAADSDTSAAAPTNAEICSFFFEPALDEAAPSPADADGASPAASAAALASPPAPKRGRKPKGGSNLPAVDPNGRANRHRCRLCLNVYTQNASTGYTNLMTHLRIKHSDWPEILRSQRLPPPVLAAAAPAAASSATPAPKTESTAAYSAPSTPLPVPQRMAVGRKRGPVYGHFEDLPDAEDDGKKTKRVRCKHCGAVVAQNSGRLKSHLATGCTEAPVLVRIEYAAQASGAVKVEAGQPAIKRQKRASLGPGVVVGDVRAASAPIKAVSAAAMPPRPTGGKGSGAYAFEEKLTAAVVAARVPWAFLDNKQFQEALAVLAYPPGFERGPDAVEFPLTAARASTVVVHRLADDYDRAAASALGQAKFSTIVVDRRELSSSRERVKLVAVDELRRSYLLTSRVRDAGSTTADTAAFVRDVLEAGVRAQPFPPSAKLLLCSDATAGHFTQLRKQLQDRLTSSAFPLVGSCMAQQSALLIKDVLRETETASTIASAAAIAQALRAVPEFSHTPSADDWASIAQSVRRVASQESCVREAFAAKTLVRDDGSLVALAAVVRNDGFWTTLKAVDALLTPLVACAAMSELPSATSGQYLSLWLWAFALAMDSPLMESSAAKVRFADRFFRRIQVYVEDHQIVSLVLDPRVQGVGLSSSGFRRARGVAVRVAASLIPALDETSFVRSYNDYVKKQGDFGDDGLWNAANTSDPLHFWSDFDGDALHGQLARVALAVSAFVPHVQSVQTYWSTPVAGREEEDAALEAETLDKIRFASEGAKERRVHDMIAKYGSLVGIQPITAGATVASDVLDGEPTQSTGSVFKKSSLEGVLSSIVDHLDEDVAEAAASGSGTKLDVSWLDMTAAGSAKAQATAATFFDSVGSSAARFGMELVV